jgi:2-hydroxy-3-oxopropionate reductase
MTAKPTIGFIGLGVMGKPMARNLLRAGYPLVVGNRSAAAAAELVAEGAQRGESAAAVAKRADVLITMLPDSPDVEAVVFGPDGILGALRAGAIHVDMSTIAPATARRIATALRERGVAALDAPVSGGEKGAIEGTLSIMIGGPAESVAAVRPILETLGKTIVHVGDAGAGQVTKAANQLVVGATIEAVAEALALAENAGVDPAAVRSALLGGFAQSRILDMHGQRMLDGAFAPGFRARLHLKDLEIVHAAAEELGLELPAAETTRRRMRALVERGGGELDHSALRTLIAQKSESVVGGAGSSAAKAASSG